MIPCVQLAGIPKSKILPSFWVVWVARLKSRRIQEQII